MSGPLSNRKFVELAGLTEARAQIKALPKLLIDAMGKGALEAAERMAGRARGLAPTRKTPVGNYAGGALKAHIAAKLLPNKPVAIVGIAGGATVVTTAGKQLEITRPTTRTKTDLRRYRLSRKTGKMVKNKRFGRTRTYTALLTKAQRVNIKAAGHVLIHPSRYGHYIEFGPISRARLPGRPFMRPAAAAEQGAFEATMRGHARAMETVLAEMGFKR